MNGSLQKSKRKLKILTSKWQQRHNNPKPMGCRGKTSPKREVYSNTSLPQETVKAQKKTLHLKKQEREEQTKPNVCRRKEIIKIWVKLNETEMKKIIEKINETKTWFFEKIKKLINSRPDSSRKKRGFKSIKLEMKNKLQQTSQKCKRS